MHMHLVNFDMNHLVHHLQVLFLNLLYFDYMVLVLYIHLHHLLHHYLDYLLQYQ